MNREIKFRGFNKKTKTMIDLYKITPLALGSADLTGLFIPFDENIELMQFTGQLDKTEKEIYEGDIVEYSWRNGGGKERFAVEWDDKHHGFNCLFDFWANAKSSLPGSTGGILRPLKYKVIGNIWENGDLLK